VLYQKILRVFAFFVFVFLLAGCAQLKLNWRDKPYKVPSSQATATMYYDVPAQTTIGLFADSKCSVGSYGSNISKQLKAGSSVDIKKITRKITFLSKKKKFKPFNQSIKQVKIPAGKRIFMTFFLNKEVIIDGEDGVYRCAINVGFTPKAGQEYMSVFQTKKKRCSVSLLDLNMGQKVRYFVQPKDMTLKSEDCSK